MVAKLEAEDFKLMELVKRALLFLACLLIGWCFAELLATIPSGMRLDVIPVHPFMFITVILSAIMLKEIFSNCPRKTQLITIAAIIVYSIISYFITIETPEDVRFDPNVLRLLTMLICAIAVLPFFGEKRLIKFSKDNAERDSIFFATSVMWLSPFISELFIGLKWYIEGVFWERISYMTLGGAGTKDILFRYGFWALASLTLFHLLKKLLLLTRKFF